MACRSFYFSRNLSKSELGSLQRFTGHCIELAICCWLKETFLKEKIKFAHWRNHISSCYGCPRRLWSLPNHGACIFLINLSYSLKLGGVCYTSSRLLIRADQNNVSFPWSWPPGLSTILCVDVFLRSLYLPFMIRSVSSRHFPFIAFRCAESQT